ncbi:hypothetical protein [Nioella sp.]
MAHREGKHAQGPGLAQPGKPLGACHDPRHANGTWLRFRPGERLN